MKHNWEYKRLNEISNELFAGGDVPKNRQKEQSAEYSIPIYTNGVECEGLYGYCDSPRVKCNAITIASRGTIGAIFKRTKPFTPAIRLITIVPANEVTIDFLTYALRNVSIVGNGGTIPQLTVPMVRDKLIPVPPMEVQEQIVAELDGINAQIDRCRQLVRTLDSLATSLFYDTFGDPVTNPKGWETKKFADVLLLKAGKSIKASELSNTYSEGLYPCFGGNGLRGFIAKKSHSGEYCIIGRQGALCGNIKITNGDFYATEHAIVVTPLIEVSTKWLFYTLTFMNLNKYAKGVAQPGLSVTDLKKLPIHIPPLSLQEQFAAQVESIEAQKAKVEATIEELQTLLDSRMDYWFN